MKTGQLGQAMAEYEALESWEKLIGCYMVTGRPRHLSRRAMW